MQFNDRIMQNRKNNNNRNWNQPLIVIIDVVCKRLKKISFVLNFKGYCK